MAAGAATPAEAAGQGAVVGMTSVAGAATVSASSNVGRISSSSASSRGMATRGSAVTGAGAKRRLSPLNTGDVDARLVRDGDGDAIVEPSGRRIPIGPGVEGFVDRTRGSARLVVFEGWAGDTQSRRPAERVVAFSGDRLIASVRPDLPRPDLVKAYGPSLAKAGFQLGGETTFAEGGSPAPELRVFAVLDGEASPIEGVKPPTGG